MLNRLTLAKGLHLLTHQFYPPPAPLLLVDMQPRKGNKPSARQAQARQQQG